MAMFEHNMYFEFFIFLIMQNINFNNYVRFTNIGPVGYRQPPIY